MFGLLKVAAVAPSLHQIHTALQEHQYAQAATLLLTYLTHHETQAILKDTFGQCAGILNYVNVVMFSDEIPTAQCNIYTGKVEVGITFFQNHIRTPNDFLFILLHERNHYLMHLLQYANVQGLSARQQNIVEDVYINGGLYPILKPPFMEGFYKDPIGLETILHPNSDLFGAWLQELQYPNLNIWKMHSRMYQDGHTIDYQTWLHECRALIYWLQEKQRQVLEEFEKLKTIGSIEMPNTLPPPDSGGSHDGAPITDAEGYPLHKIIVPSLNLEGVEGRLIQDSWDTSLECLLPYF